MATNPDDDLEFPEMTEEMLTELRTPPKSEPEVDFQSLKNTDLHLGVPQVRTSNVAWLKQYGPKPPGPMDYAIDGIIVVMFIATSWIMMRALVWSFWS